MLLLKRLKNLLKSQICKKAKEYLADGSYLLNGGMFMWNCSNIIEQIKKYSPDTYEALNKISSVEEKEYSIIYR